MRHGIIVIGIVWSMSVVGCGAATSGESTTAMASGEWTQSELRKLDPELRTRVRSAGTSRIPVKVYFFELPSDSELADLMLNRLGEQAIGQLDTDALQRLAARHDVERIEPLRDVGYEMN